MDFDSKGKPLPPEKVKAKHTKMHCKLCGKDMVGKSTMSRHLGAAHGDIPADKRERILIDEYFGPARVSKVLHDYIEGKFNLTNLPIDISRYIYLAGIKQKKEIDIPDKTTHKSNPIEKFNLIIIDKHGKLGEKQIESDDPDKPNYITYAVKNIAKMRETGDLCLKVQRTPRDGSYPTSSISYEILKRFIEENYDTNDMTGKLFVTLNGVKGFDPIPVRNIKITKRKFKKSTIDRQRIAVLKKTLTLQKKAKEIINKRSGRQNIDKRNIDRILKNYNNPSINNQKHKQKIDIVTFCRLFV